LDGSLQCPYSAEKKTATKKAKMLYDAKNMIASGEGTGVNEELIEVLLKDLAPSLVIAGYGYCPSCERKKQTNKNQSHRISTSPLYESPRREGTLSATRESEILV